MSYNQSFVKLLFLVFMTIFTTGSVFSQKNFRVGTPLEGDKTGLPDFDITPGGIPQKYEPNIPIYESPFPDNKDYPSSDDKNNKEQAWIEEVDRRQKEIAAQLAEIEHRENMLYYEDIYSKLGVDAYALVNEFSIKEYILEKGKETAPKSIHKKILVSRLGKNSLLRVHSVVDIFWAESLGNGSIPINASQFFEAFRKHDFDHVIVEMTREEKERVLKLVSEENYSDLFYFMTSLRDEYKASTESENTKNYLYQEVSPPSNDIPPSLRKRN